MADHDDPERGTVDLTPAQIAAAEKEKAQLLAGIAIPTADAIASVPRAARVGGPAGEGNWPDQRPQRARAVAEPEPAPKPKAKRAARTVSGRLRPPVADEGDLLAPWTLEEALANVAEKKREYEEAKQILLEIL